VQEKKKIPPHPPVSFRRGSLGGGKAGRRPAKRKAERESRNGDLLNRPRKQRFGSTKLWGHKKKREKLGWGPFILFFAGGGAILKAKEAIGVGFTHRIGKVASIVLYEGLKAALLWTKLDGDRFLGGSKCGNDTGEGRRKGFSASSTRP